MLAVILLILREKNCIQNLEEQNREEGDKKKNVRREKEGKSREEGEKEK